MAGTTYRRLLPVLAAVLIATGCAPTFPSHITERVDARIKYADLMKDPETYKGKWVMLAGDIVTARAEKDGSTYLEILQRPAYSNGKPMDTDESGGRFIAVSREFLDPAVYGRGRVITIVGEVVGDSVKPLGAVAYRYPLLEVQALHLWDPYSSPRTNVSIGVGVFHRF